METTTARAWNFTDTLAATRAAADAAARELAQAVAGLDRSTWDVDELDAGSGQWEGPA